jgi:hypothetical protein
VKAIKEDAIRVVYYDGQVAEFKIARWPSSYPLEFETKLASANQQTRPYYVMTASSTCYGDRGGSGGTSTPITVETGYWGVTYWWDNAAQIGGTTASWIGTGTFTFFASTYTPYPRRCP